MISSVGDRMPGFVFNATGCLCCGTSEKQQLSNLKLHSLLCFLDRIKQNNDCLYCHLLNATIIYVKSEIQLVSCTGLKEIIDRLCI